MDASSSDLQRHKRSFTEMSQQTTLSPSPLHFRDPSSIFPRRESNRPSPSAHTIEPSLLNRRRTPHPHNRVETHIDSENMLGSNRSQSRPQAQAVTIDLISDSEDDTMPSHNQSRDTRPLLPSLTSFSPAQRNRGPPSLERSDASELRGRDFVDLTEDADEPEIMITGARELPAPRFHRGSNRPGGPIPIAHYQPPRARIRQESPSLFLPHPPAQAQGLHRMHRLIGGPMNAIGAALGFGGIRGRGIGPNDHDMLEGAAAFMAHVNMFADVGAMPGRMDYRTGGLDGPARKPDHVAPKAARENFTRSPQEDDIIVCPSCDQELVHNKQEEEPPMKKSGKAPTRKEREEHPFWVIKECGHVYCNKCYQNRTSNGKLPDVNFPETTKTTRSKPTKSIACAVDECESDAKSKEKWVGVFL